MNRQPNRYLASTQRRLSQYGTGIEWEELPSLTERLVNVDTRRGDFQHSSGFSTTWDCGIGSRHCRRARSRRPP